MRLRLPTLDGSSHDAAHLHRLRRFVTPSEANVSKIRAALRSLWNDPQIDEINAAELAGDYPTIRYGPPAGNIVIDLLAGLGTAWQFEDLESETPDFGGVPVRVATPKTCTG